MKKKRRAAPLHVGLIGCGAISDHYFLGLSPFSKLAQITACADLDDTRAREKAEKYAVAARTVDDLLADDDIDIILNLTIPKSHAEINLAALRAGKHAYCEKPFSLTTREGLKVLAEAEKRNLRVGCAPDTVLGGGIQSSRHLIDSGVIGRPVAATANMLCRGHERWHPSPEFYYTPGGGPLFDMGPYYLTSLVTFLGPAKSVTASATMAFRERSISSRPLHGKKIRVQVPTHLTGSIAFANSVVATVTMSFDVWKHHLPILEIYGTEGSLVAPDPNRFDGVSELWTEEKPAWRQSPVTHCVKTQRGLGVAEMAHAILHRRPHRASAELALHVVEIMEAFHLSAAKGKKISLKSSCKRPAPLPAGLGIPRF